MCWNITTSLRQRGSRKIFARLSLTSRRTSATLALDVMLGEASRFTRRARCRVRTCDLSPRRPLTTSPFGSTGLVISNSLFLIATFTRAISSVVEHLLHTQGVAGSIPASRMFLPAALALQRMPFYLKACQNIRLLSLGNAATRRSSIRNIRAITPGNLTVDTKCKHRLIPLIWETQSCGSGRSVCGIDLELPHANFPCRSCEKKVRAR